MKTEEAKAETAAGAPTAMAEKAKGKAMKPRKAKAAPKAEKRAARAPKAKGKPAQAARKPRAKVRARPMGETRKAARKPKAEPRAPRGQGPVIVKKVIQSADAAAMRVLVEGVKLGQLEARRDFDRMRAKFPPAIEKRAVELIEEMGLSARTAGSLAIRVAELEQQHPGAGRPPVSVSFEEDGRHSTVLCVDEPSAEAVRRLLGHLDDEEVEAAA